MAIVFATVRSTLGLSPWSGHSFFMLTSAIPAIKHFKISVHVQCYTDDRQIHIHAGDCQCFRLTSNNFEVAWYVSGKNTLARFLTLEQLGPLEQLEPILFKAVNLLPGAQTRFDDVASDCRLGFGVERPWSGVTAIVDYCTHSHKDVNNMNNGCTAVSAVGF